MSPFKNHPIPGSSCLANVGYNEQTKELIVLFVKSKQPYTYYDVPPFELRNLLNAKSKGKYFDQNIRYEYSSNYEYMKNNA
jgi:hypothetical protein